MKKLNLLTAIMVILAMGAFAQKSKRTTAWNHIKWKEWDKAKVAIDEAVVHEQTKDDAVCWYYRGVIYQNIANDSTLKNLDPDPLKQSFDSYKKSLELDPKSVTAGEAKRNVIMLSRVKGQQEYIAKKYADAIPYFEYALSQMPNDTFSLEYAAYSADYANLNDKAKGYYQKLIEMKVKEAKPEKTNFYLDLARIYLGEKDTAKALEWISKGKERYPEAGNLLREEVNIYLASNRSVEAIDRLNTAITKEPGDANLYLVLGNIYDRLANPKDPKGEDLPKPANYKELLTKAEGGYKKAIELKPDNFDALFRLGGLYFNQAAEMFNDAQKIPPREVDKYKKAEVAFKAKFAEAKPYLEKAHQIDPKDKDIMLSLKQLYARLDEMEKSNEMKKKLEGTK